MLKAGAKMTARLNHDRPRGGGIETEVLEIVRAECLLAYPIDQGDAAAEIDRA